MKLLLSEAPDSVVLPRLIGSKLQQSPLPNGDAKPGKVRGVWNERPTRFRGAASVPG